MEVSQALDKTKRSQWDADEIEEEERERILRQKLNEEFQKFVRKVEELSGSIEFDIPYRELGFYGVPFRSNVFLQPTVHCLVQLIELPFLVVNLSDIDIAYFERVQFSLRNFDLVLIYKDRQTAPTHINTIPMESLDPIKEWLDSCDIKYYEGPVNLNWPKIIKETASDPKKFIEEGGWSFLEPDSDENNDSESEAESNFSITGSEESESYESEEEYEENEEEDEEEDEDFGSEDEDSEEGLSWEELEERAKKADSERGAFDEKISKKTEK